MSDRVDAKMLGDKELLNMFKALGNDKVRIKELTMFIKKAMKPIRNTQKSNILSMPNKSGGKEFIIYRDGKKHHTDKQQLAKSIQVFKKQSKSKQLTGYYSGPRLKGGYKSMAKSGFFGLWIEYGTKYSLTGKGKINLKPRPFTNTTNVITGKKLAGENIVNKESKAIQQTIKRFKKKY